MSTCLWHDHQTLLTIYRLLLLLLFIVEKGLKIAKGRKSKKGDNTIAKGKVAKGQTIIPKTLHRKHEIHELH